MKKVAACLRTNPRISWVKSLCSNIKPMWSRACDQLLPCGRPPAQQNSQKDVRLLQIVCHPVGRQDAELVSQSLRWRLHCFPQGGAILGGGSRNPAPRLASMQSLHVPLAIASANRRPWQRIPDPLLSYLGQCDFSSAIKCK